MSGVHQTDRSYRRGAIMGLTMAEAFILIAFTLLLLFAFWQWEKEKENTPAVRAFKELSHDRRQTVLGALEDGSLDELIGQTEPRNDFKEKWRFIDKDELVRLIDAASSLPEDVQRDLADMVESQNSQEILKQMALLEALMESGQNIADLLAQSDMAKKVEESGMSMDEVLSMAKDIGAIEESGHSLEDLASTAKTIDSLLEEGRTLDELTATADTLAEMEKAGQTLEGISQKIQNAEDREEILASTLRRKLGGIVSRVGGSINENGEIILPDNILFEQGKAAINPVFARFLEDACEPWLSVLKNSGLEISEVRIEGHASSEWRSGSSAREAYLGNLDLSQRRSQAVLRMCLDFLRSPETRDWARNHMIAVGYSSVRPVVRSGEEDRAASRRVVLSVTPDREDLLNEIGAEAETQLSDP